MPSTIHSISSTTARGTRITRKRVSTEGASAVKKIRPCLETKAIPKSKEIKTGKCTLKNTECSNEICKVKEDPLPEPFAPAPVSIEVLDDDRASSTESTDTDSPPRTLKLADVLSGESISPSSVSERSKQYYDPLEYLSPAILAIPEGIIDIYATNEKQCPDYLISYVHYLWCMENDVAMRPNMERRKVPGGTVTADMRRCLVDWMFDIAQEYNAQPTTLYLSVTLLDRALDKMAVRRSKLQLLGCACFLIAAKIEEVTAPTVEGMLDISARSYEHREMVECEMMVSKELYFRLTGVTSAHFLDHFLKVAQLNPKQEALAKYICDLSLMDYSFVGIKPSLIAASVIHLTRQTTISCKNAQDIWTPSLRFYTRYESYNSDLRSTVKKLRRAHFTAWDGNFSAMRRKYQHSDLYHASEILCMSEDDLKF